MPIKADTEVTEDDWKNHHILLIGRPEANAAVERAPKNLPVTFGASVVHDPRRDLRPSGTAVIVAGENPFSPRFGVVLFAGLGAESTWHCVEELEGNTPRWC